MSRTDYFVATAIGLLVAACADPACPPDYIINGDQCIRCPDGKPAVKWRCLSDSEAGASVANDASTEAHESPTPDARTPDPASAVGDAALASVDASFSIDSGSSTFDAAGSSGPQVQMDAQKAIGVAPIWRTDLTA